MPSERVLLVEDEKIIALDLERRLTKFGLVVCATTSTGREAIELAASCRPDLILMDVALEGDIDGISAALAIARKSDVPLIFLTAGNDDQTFERATEAEPFAIVIKPFKERELRVAIETALRKHRAIAAERIRDRWLTTLLEEASIGFLATDSNNVVRFANRNAHALLGAEGRSPIGNPLPEFRGRDELSDATQSQGVSLPPVLAKRDYELLDERGNRVGRIVILDPDNRPDSRSEPSPTAIDELTGLFNRATLSRRLESLLVNEQPLPHALLYLDLDRFGTINDACGSGAGDELLRQTTAIIRSAVRSGDTCARIGSDEFGVLLENSSLGTAEQVCRRLKESIGQHKFIWGRKVYSVSSSIGLVALAEPQADSASVLTAADDACYAAKDLGGNQVRVYERSDTFITRRRSEAQRTARLNDAIMANRFTLYYQPIVPIRDVRKGRLCEILLRLTENGRLLLPSDFLPEAGRNNLMPKIDRWVVSTAITACRDFRRDRGTGAVGQVYCVNLSCASVTDQSFPEFVAALFDQLEVPPSAFCFEVPESVAVTEADHTVRTARELRGLGCALALDDFGSGLSSFTRLKGLCVDYVKIDGSFVHGLLDDPSNRSMVEAIHGLGKVMKTQTIAEFAAGGPLLEELHEIGVDYAQGERIAAAAPVPG